MAFDAKAELQKHGWKEGDSALLFGFMQRGIIVLFITSAMGKMRNCGMRNAEGKMRNGMCGATVIGRDLTPRDRSHSAFHRTPCVECMQVKCILNMRKIAFCTVYMQL